MSYSSQYPPAQNDTYVKATSDFSSNYLHYFATDPSKNLIGSPDYNSWASEYGVSTNQRFHIDLGSAKVVSRIYYENWHSNGIDTVSGIKTFTFWGSNSNDAFEDLIYSHDDDWIQLSTSQTTFDQHTTSNVEDPKYILITNSTAYRYYAIKIEDNWGNALYMALRRIELQISSTKQETILSDSIIKIINEASINSNSKILTLNNQESLSSDALITNSLIKTIISNTKILVPEINKTILSDSKVIISYQNNLLSDAKLLAIGEQKTIFSSAKIAIQVLYNINQKFNTATRVLSNILNKINTSISVISNINNFVNTCYSVLSNVRNDFRTRKLTLNNVNNDIRFLYSWQKTATGVLQSLGKTYIKVYINSVEQTDVDVDSINIGKDWNVAHSASFDLGRAYDSTKPIMKSTVEIKYNNWVLYSGYITQISPAESPEKIRIGCYDEYWKENQSNSYYHVGHQPTDDRELYYSNIASALLSEHSWNLPIGNFVPQEINNFGIGKSDAISNLIQESGNYGWFYDVDGTKKLITAGTGSIININRQVLGTNIGLYDLLSHSFNEKIDEITNKYRVQMGEKVIRKFSSAGGSRTYAGYNYASYHQYVEPLWDASLEMLSRYTSSGYGFDHPDPDNLEAYRDVFTKYSMPYLNPDLSSWSDRYPPYVEIYTTTWRMFNCVAEKLTDGFTIDYENGILTLNEPRYLYNLDANGECSSVRAPAIKLFLWKKDYYTYTVSPSEDPESEVSNPLMFFTDKMGDYSETIIKDLNLSNLSIQVGGVNGTEIIPSWDDTAFALDYANWELSKHCDKKIFGSIELTLDAVCFYGIDLTKRIYISGITETPMNIISMSYNLSNFTVTIQLENKRYFNRTVSLASHGE